MSYLLFFLYIGPIVIVYYIVVINSENSSIFFRFKQLFETEYYYLKLNIYISYERISYFEKIRHFCTSYSKTYGRNFLFGVCNFRYEMDQCKLLIYLLTPKT